MYAVPHYPLPMPDGGGEMDSLLEPLEATRFVQACVGADGMDDRAIGWAIRRSQYLSDVSNQTRHKKRPAPRGTGLVSLRVGLLARGCRHVVDRRCRTFVDDAVERRTIAQVSGAVLEDVGQSLEAPVPGHTPRIRRSLGQTG